MCREIAGPSHWWLEDGRWRSRQRWGTRPGRRQCAHPSDDDGIDPGGTQRMAAHGKPVPDPCVTDPGGSDRLVLRSSPAVPLPNQPFASRSTLMVPDALYTQTDVSAPPVPPGQAAPSRGSRGPRRPQDSASRRAGHATRCMRRFRSNWAGTRSTRLVCCRQHRSDSTPQPPRRLRVSVDPMAGDVHRQAATRYGPFALHAASELLHPTPPGAIGWTSPVTSLGGSGAKYPSHPRAR